MVVTKNNMSTQYSVFTDSDIKKLLKTLSTHKHYRKKWSRYKISRLFLMVLLSYSLGLRPKETNNIKIHNIDFKKQLLLIPAEDNKQRFQDYVFIPKFLIIYIKNYLKTRKYKESPYLFASYTFKPLDRSNLSQEFRDLLKRAGFYKTIHICNNRFLGNYNFYTLRHSFATNAYLKLRDIQAVAILLRHRDKQHRTTSRYIHAANNDIRKELIKRLYK